METELRQDLSEANLTLIYSGLDDLQLTVHAFRLYCHLARRAGKTTKTAWPSIASMARICRMNEDTVGRALKELLERNTIVREERKGRSSLYILTPPSLWNKVSEEDAKCSKTSPKRGGTGKEGVPPSFRGDPPESRGYHPPESRGYEGIPRKVLHEGLAGGSADPPTTIAPEPVPQPAQKRPARRNLAFDTLAEIDGTQAGGMTPVEASRIGKCLADIRAAWPERLPEKPTPDDRTAYEARLAEEIRRRADRYRQVMPHAQLTACALVAHWGKCQAARPLGIGTPLPTAGGKWALPDGCDWRGLARTLGIRIAFDTPWHEVSHAHRAAILDAHASARLVS
jgi:hypothetical protein